jgi:16S rRNA C967 or C1407 C5-methylase (RsmB/RsmF family)/NOL1/NOP2/fmu family ribosome biogenesis protein
MHFPEAFVNRMQSALPDQWPALQAAHAQPSPVSIRANPRKRYQPAFTKIPWTQHGYYLPERPVFTLDPLFHGGAYYVQEASSMLIEQAFTQATDATGSLRVLDLCAAPGGKSTHLLSLMNEQSLLVSNEVIRSRASVLSENIQKWGHANVVVSNNDPKDFERLSGYFDVIVVDAPCSGEGLFRKDPHAMQEWSENNVTLCSQRQQRILADVWPALKENGLLIYSTCTYNDIENEGNLKWLAENKEVEFVSHTMDAKWGVTKSVVGNMVGYHCYPHLVQGEGFFMAVVRKREATTPPVFRTKNVLPLLAKKTAEQLNHWLQHPHLLIQLNELIVALPEEFATEINWLTQQLNVLTKGTALATMKHDKFIPEHAAALSIELQTDQFIQLDVSLEEALAYLRKETPLLGEGRKGFALVTYQKTPLGWVNLLGNRLNNLYPANWRVRMAGS